MTRFKRLERKSITLESHKYFCSYVSSRIKNLLFSPQIWYYRVMDRSIDVSKDRLTQGHCVPCEGGTIPLTEVEVATYLTILKTPWHVTDEGKKIEKKFGFKNFKGSMEFVNKVAELAESEGHHPDIAISYDKVDIRLSTHAIGGLSTNDFILASKIELMYK